MLGGQRPSSLESSAIYEERKDELLSFAISLRPSTVVISRFILCKTRDFSVLYSKDLIILNVNVADVFGLARFVRTSEVAPSPDMVSVSETRRSCELDKPTDY